MLACVLLSLPKNLRVARRSLGVRQTFARCPQLNLRLIPREGLIGREREDQRLHKECRSLDVVGRSDR